MIHRNLLFLALVSSFFTAIWVHSEATADALMNASDYNNRGLYKWQHGDMGGALQDYGEAIDKDPNFALAYLNRSTVRQAKGDYSGAEADLDEAIRIDHTLFRAYFLRGDVREQLGDTKGASADFKEGIRQCPANCDNAYYSFHAKGFLQFHAGAYTKAAQSYRRAAELAPSALSRLYCHDRDLAKIIASGVKPSKSLETNLEGSATTKAHRAWQKYDTDLKIWNARRDAAIDRANLQGNQSHSRLAPITVDSVMQERPIEPSMPRPFDMR